MPTYKDILTINEQYALDNNKEDTAVKRLLLHYAQMSSSELLLHLSDEMPEDKYQDFLYAVDRYVIQHVPIQHIIGTEQFFGYDFKVNGDVLIPRFETEELVANVLLLYDEVFHGEPVDVVDIGTGSGCLAVTLSLEEANMTVLATDISDKALAVAKDNNATLGGRVTFVKGDLLEPLQGKRFDIVVSNPPYIPDDEFVEDIIKDHEPHLALYGGEDGLDCYRGILRGIGDHLKDRYIIAFEHAFNTAKEIKTLVKKHLPDATIIQKKDMQGKDRMTFVVKR